MSKVKFEMEFPIHASPNMLYQYFSTSSGLQEWFADTVNSRGKKITFSWDGAEEHAEVVVKKSNERIRFRWLDNDDNEENYFEFKIQVDSITKDVSLIITDFADDEDDVEESKMLWESQIDELKQTIGA